eukprot:SAG31_NODE_5037_length_2783_cov_49.453800_1_plen_134_part_00
MLVPACRRIVGTLRAHAPFVEWPSKEWLRQTFPLVPSWDAYPNNMLGITFVAYTAAWERILDEWSAEVFTIVRPAHPFAGTGLQRCMDWSYTRGQTKQAELIGMTADNELDMNVVTNTLDMANQAAETMTKNG